MEEEEWRQTREGPEYLASSGGEVYSVRRDMILTPWVTSSGYLQVDLTIRGRRMVRYLQRVIYGAFHTQFGPESVIKFINGDRFDCRIDNLYVEDFDYSDVEPVENYRVKGLPIYVPELDMAFGNAYQAAEVLGADPDNIRKCLKGQRRKHLGLTFQYLDV